MGTGYGFICTRCKKKYRVSFGSGFCPELGYEEAIKDIRLGKYGGDWKVLYEYIPNLVMDPDYTVYICECGHWENEMDVTLYAPNNPVDIQMRIDKECEKYGDEGKHFYEAWLSAEERNEQYHILREYNRICPKCRSIMKKISYEEVEWLSCPECGEINRRSIFTLSD